MKLSPQELRQALFPGEFSDFVDEAASGSTQLQALLSRHDPDPRMRDVELLARYLGFRNYLNAYAGRMSTFIDSTCERLNRDWQTVADRVKLQVDDFNQGTQCLIDIFGQDRVARKSDSRSFNRAVFDALSFYASDNLIRDRMNSGRNEVVKAYDDVLRDARFSIAIESDTAGIPNTLARLEAWGVALRGALGLQFAVPRQEGSRICFDGLWRDA